MKRFLFFAWMPFLTVNAASISLQLAPLDEVVSVSDVSLSQVQAKIFCSFKSARLDGKDIIRERYILTRLDRIEEGRYRVRTGKAKIQAWVPDAKLQKCGYQLIALGEDLEGNGLIGDLTLVDSGLSEENALERIKRRINAMLLGKVGERENARLEDIGNN